MVSRQERNWSRKWMKIRSDYLEGKLPDFALHPAEDSEDLWFWECLEYEAQGEASLSWSWSRAELAATGHVGSHVSPEDREILEDINVAMMPWELLTIAQRARKRQVEAWEK